jgi:hypothetical protein
MTLQELTDQLTKIASEAEAIAIDDPRVDRVFETMSAYYASVGKEPPTRSFALFILRESWCDRAIKAYTAWAKTAFPQYR